jgi:uncharacterized protein DUF3795
MVNGMPEITAADEKMMAYCGIYCGECGKHLKFNCKGCLNGDGNPKCLVISCCTGHGYRTCAECDDYVDCDKFTNFKNRKDNLSGIKTMELTEWLTGRITEIE